jgi:hypothetical protein
METLSPFIFQLPAINGRRVLVISGSVQVRLRQALAEHDPPGQMLMFYWISD